MKLTRKTLRTLIESVILEQENYDYSKDPDVIAKKASYFQKGKNLVDNLYNAQKEFAKADDIVYSLIRFQNATEYVNNDSDRQATSGHREARNKSFADLKRLGVTLNNASSVKPLIKNYKSEQSAKLASYNTSYNELINLGTDIYHFSAPRKFSWEEKSEDVKAALDNYLSQESNPRLRGKSSPLYDTDAQQDFQYYQTIRRFGTDVFGRPNEPIGIERSKAAKEFIDAIADYIDSEI